MKRSELLGLFGSIAVAACLSALPYIAPLLDLFSYVGNTELAIVFFVVLSAALGVAAAYVTSARTFASVFGGLIGFSGALWALHKSEGLGNGGHGDLFLFFVAAPGIMSFCAGAGIGSMILRHVRHRWRR